MLGPLWFCQYFTSKKGGRPSSMMLKVSKRYCTSSLGVSSSLTGWVVSVCPLGRSKAMISSFPADLGAAMLPYADILAAVDGHCARLTRRRW